MAINYLKEISTAHANVYDVARETPLEQAVQLSARLGNEVLFKREDLQPVFSFKLRGAYNKIYQLSLRQNLSTVVAASAGNHAQGVALAAQRLGIKAVIVMPKTTPRIKVDAVKAYGAKILLHGDNYDEACARAYTVAEQESAPFIHPYDDPEVIAGQGTVAVELLRQCQQDIEAIFVPIGGGGLAAGIAAYVKAIKPHIKVIGVEPADAPSMQQALARQRRVRLKQVGIFADGVAVKQAGKETYRLCRQHLDAMVLVSTDEICAAIKDIYDDTRSIAEPAGAVATAGVKKYCAEQGWHGKRVISLISGANMNFDRLRHVAERAELGEQREMLLGVTIPERPGSFKKFCADLGKRNITEFNYRYADRLAAQVFAGVELSGGAEEKAQLLQQLQAKGYELQDLSDNEMAKLHIRYMVGGHQGNLGRERLFRFEFPERPGALQLFLNTLGSRWNISLFHYRNHGSANGRVLVGLQIEQCDDAAFKAFLHKLAYEFFEESDNPAYALFLGERDDAGQLR